MFGVFSRWFIHGPESILRPHVLQKLTKFWHSKSKIPAQTHQGVKIPAQTFKIQKVHRKSFLASNYVFFISLTVVELQLPQVIYKKPGFFVNKTRLIKKRNGTLGNYVLERNSYYSNKTTRRHNTNYQCWFDNSKILWIEASPFLLEWILILSSFLSVWI